MVVRIKVKLVRGNREVTTSALVNTGYEADEPEITLPVRVA